jgi:hypothetical protein
LLQFSSPKQFKTELGVASFLIPKKQFKTVQNKIRGLLHFSSPKVFIYKILNVDDGNPPKSPHFFILKIYFAFW